MSQSDRHVSWADCNKGPELDTVAAYLSLAQVIRWAALVDWTLEAPTLGGKATVIKLGQTAQVGASEVIQRKGIEACLGEVYW